MKTVLTLACLCLFLSGFGQGITTCQLSGQIKNESGDQLTGAIITLSNNETNYAYQATTSESGNYVITNIKPDASFSLKIESEGNEYVIFNDKNLAVGERYVINYAIKPMSVDIETVNISDVNNDDLNITSGRLGTLIQRDELEMFPSINRSILDYLSLNPHASSVGFLGKGSRAN